ncbi:GspH/FimT family protein [Thermus scotoductus]|uniref:GspH/FimT family protein n=1 Tax=Thermus scotoductus TaxID=37636 RepID=UPI00242D014E|nr:GspH/FimT family protein [Thermus scotoductus]
MRSAFGLSLLELVVVLAVLGILLALGTGYLNSDRTAVNQAAQSLAAQVTRARLEAIRRNEFVGLALRTNGAGGYAVFLDTDRDGVQDAGETILQTVTFGQGDWARVRLSGLQQNNTAVSSATLVFDTRGVPQNFAILTITLSNRAETYTKTVQISEQGRATIP